MTSQAPIEDGFRRLFAANDRLRATMRRVVGLSVHEEMTLLLLDQGITAPSRLSRAIGMTTAGMTNLLDRMEADGLLRREPHATDKRRVLVTLTKKGYRTRISYAAVSAELARLAASYPADESAAIGRFLEHAVAELERRAEESED